MKKSIKKYTPHLQARNVLSEPAAIYHISTGSSRKEPLLKDFTYSIFKKISNKGPFTLAEWANMLFISERTLNRYAKDNSAFNGLQIERILLLQNLIDMGNGMFGEEGFKAWLQSRPFSLGGDIVKDKLNTHNGIQDVIDTLGRIQHGISA